MAGPTPEFWQARFAGRQTPWDRGAAHPQLRRWLGEGVLSPGGLGPSIVVPGCGSGYELPLLAAAGFETVGIDYAPAAIAFSRERVEAEGLGGKVRLEQADVLDWQPEAAVGAVYEQTCLCALHPDHWQAYAAQLARWLSPGGRLFALFMQSRRDSAASGQIEGPPYHCDVNAMRSLFPAPAWEWPKPPFERIAHPMGMEELAVVLRRR